MIVTCSLKISSVLSYPEAISLPFSLRRASAQFVSHYSACWPWLPGSFWMTRLFCFILCLTQGLAVHTLSFATLALTLLFLLRFTIVLIGILVHRQFYSLTIPLNNSNSLYHHGARWPTFFFDLLPYSWSVLLVSHV